jgi:hypothetical protein
MNSQLNQRPTAKGWGSMTEAEILQVFRQAREFQAIAAHHVPKGCRVIYREVPVINGKVRADLDGVYICEKPTLVRHLTRPKRVIQAPRPITVESLHVFLHECAHAHLGHHDRRIRGGVGRLPEYLEEMQAEQWSLDTMRNHGIAVPRHVINDMREYVANKIVKAERKGATIDPAAYAFVGKDALKMERNKYRGRKPLPLKARQGRRKQTRQQSRSASG